MGYEVTNDTLSVGMYLAYMLWIIMAVMLLMALIRRDWILKKRVFKFLLNSVVFIIAFMFYLELALIVKPAMYDTREQTSFALKEWIQKHQNKDAVISLIVILFLVGVNLWFDSKVEKKKHRVGIFILTFIDSAILFAGIWLTGQSAYCGLMQEVNRHFN